MQAVGCERDFEVDLVVGATEVRRSAQIVKLRLTKMLSPSHRLLAGNNPLWRF